MDPNESGYVVKQLDIVEIPWYVLDNFAHFFMEINGITFVSECHYLNLQ